MQTERGERFIEQDVSGSARTLSAQEYLHKLMSAVIVPFAVSVLTGLLVGLLAFVIAWLAGSLDIWPIGLITWLVVTLVVWIVQQGQRFVLILYSLEVFFKRDFNRDGSTGRPGGKVKDAKPWNVRVTLRRVEPNGHVSESRILDLPGDPAAIVTMATSFLGGASMAERLWMGDGKLFSPTDYRTIMRLFLEQKLIEPKNLRNGNNGYQLTDAGVAAMEQIRDEYSGRVAPPPPE